MLSVISIFLEKTPNILSYHALSLFFYSFAKVRFELAAKNAELQEKIAHVQTNLAEVKEEKEKESLANYQFEEKMKEKIVALERTVEVSERTRSDRKQEFIESIKELGLFHLQRL